ncbi:MAG: (R)-citramalate synthase [Parcubacteria group bacterium GW2011_GWA2_38_13]|nr:MAG: (R)-citramalate synthase [Parcubacteria group bacterium GW2011_GWA2_38_13]
MTKFIEVMDTSLRDGQQSHGMKYTQQEKLEISRHLLEKVKVDRIEVASALTSQGEFNALVAIMRWAHSCGREKQIEVLGFVDGGKSVEWIAQAGCKVINLLAKGSEQHCRVQLKLSPQEHIERIEHAISLARGLGLDVNVYLEDWSNGVENSWDYLRTLCQALSRMPIDRVMLCDTLGIMNPFKTGRHVTNTVKLMLGKKIDIHMHNDYGNATWDTIAAVYTGYVNGVHVTVNGLGERTGNADLAQVVVAIHDHTDYKTRVDELELRPVSRLVSMFSGRSIPANAPIIGKVFSSGCGVHSDGNRKGGIYQSRLTHERFGANFITALSSQSGQASLKDCLERDLGITSLTDDQIRQLRKRVADLNDGGKRLGIGDLLVLVSELANEPNRIVLSVEDGSISTRSSLGKKACVIAVLKFKGNEVHFEAEGSGGFDAFMNGLRLWAKTVDLKIPELIEYQVNIPPGGKTDALTFADITWKRPEEDGEEFQTIGTDSDQVMAAIRSAIQAVNVCNQNFSS